MAATLCLLLCAMLCVTHGARITDVAGLRSNDASITARKQQVKRASAFSEVSELGDAEEISDKEMLRRARAAPDPDDPDFCKERKYRKRTLKAIKEMPFVGLFPELQGQRRFEASGVAFAKGAYWVVFDSLRALARVDLRFSFRGPENRLVGSAAVNESQFEGLAYMESVDQFLMLRESFEHEKHGLVPLTESAKLNRDSTNYETIEQCVVHFQLEDVNKGFESLYYFERDKERHMLGLCESNYCRTIGGDDPPGLDPGHGRLVWATYRGATKDQECGWDVEKVIKLPDEAFFEDYAGISFLTYMGPEVAVVSQQDAAVWIGEFDWKEMEFVGKGRVYHFPRNDHCEKVYCNVEGLVWLDASRFVFTSDAAKSSQPFECMAKDQSIHIMALP